MSFSSSSRMLSLILRLLSISVRSISNILCNWAKNVIPSQASTNLIYLQRHYAFSDPLSVKHFLKFTLHCCYKALKCSLALLHQTKGSLSDLLRFMNYFTRVVLIISTKTHTARSIPVVLLL